MSAAEIIALLVICTLVSIGGAYLGGIVGDWMVNR